MRYGVSCFYVFFATTPHNKPRQMQGRDFHRTRVILALSVHQDIDIDESSIERCLEPPHLMLCSRKPNFRPFRIVPIISLELRHRFKDGVQQKIAMLHLPDVRHAKRFLLFFSSNLVHVRTFAGGCKVLWFFLSSYYRGIGLASIIWQFMFGLCISCIMQADM